MADGRARFVTQLENAANRVEVLAAAEIAALFKRAATRLRNIDNVSLSQDIDQALSSLAGEMNLPKSDLIRHIIREWLERNSYLPVRMLDEDGEVEGSA